MQVLASLWELYNKHVSEGNPAVTDGEQTLWAPSEMRKGGNAAERFPCCDADCTPKPYCCSCPTGVAGKAPPATEQHVQGTMDTQWIKETFQQDDDFGI